MIYANHKICPICGENVADSEHHVKPRSDGGTNTSRNKAQLCKRCHDIAEEIYDRAGLEYSPGLVKLIQLEYNFAPQTRPAEPVGSEGRMKGRKVVRFWSPHPEPDQPEGNLPLRTCARCGHKYQPAEYSQALCQTCSTYKITGREVIALARERTEEPRRRREFLSRLRKSILDTRSPPGLLVETRKRNMG